MVVKTVLLLLTWGIQLHSQVHAQYPFEIERTPNVAKALKAEWEFKKETDTHWVIQNKHNSGKDIDLNFQDKVEGLSFDILFQKNNTLYNNFATLDAYLKLADSEYIGIKSKDDNWFVVNALISNTVYSYLISAKDKTMTQLSRGYAVLVSYTGEIVCTSGFPVIYKHDRKNKQLQTNMISCNFNDFITLKHSFDLPYNTNYGIAQVACTADGRYVEFLMCNDSDWSLKHYCVLCDLKNKKISYDFGNSYEDNFKSNIDCEYDHYNFSLNPSKILYVSPLNDTILTYQLIEGKCIYYKGPQPFLTMQLKNRLKYNNSISNRPKFYSLCDVFNDTLCSFGYKKKHNALIIKFYANNNRHALIECPHTSLPENPTLQEKYFNETYKNIMLDRLNSPWLKNFTFLFNDWCTEINDHHLIIYDTILKKAKVSKLTGYTNDQQVIICEVDLFGTKTMVQIDRARRTISPVGFPNKIGRKDIIIQFKK